MAMTKGSPAIGDVRVRWFTLVVVSVGLSALGTSAGCDRSRPANGELEELRTENKRLRDEIEQLRKRTAGAPIPVVKVQSRSGSIVDGSGKAKAFEFIQGVKQGQPKVADPSNLVFMKVIKGEVGTDFIFVPINDVANVEISKDNDHGRVPIVIKTRDGKQESYQVISWWPIEVKWKGEAVIHHMPLERFLGSMIAFDK